ARAHVQTALVQGAAACLVEHQGADRFGFSDARIASCHALKQMSGPIADAYFDHPSRALQVLAVTGTNGKTSSVWWLAQALSGLPGPARRRCAMAGTLGVGFVPSADGADAPGGLQSTGLTTPDAAMLQSSLRALVQAGAQACAIEASSIGIEEHRLDATHIHTAVFTNLTQDHLDYHASMDAYGRSKEKLFRWPGLQAAVVNIDDPAGARLAHSLTGSALDVWTVSARTSARLRALAVRNSADGLQFVLQQGDQQQAITTALIGDFNVSNLLGVIATMCSLGVPLADAAAACSTVSAVPGRLQRLVSPGAPMGVVDYAHTPDALDKVIDALRPLARERSGRLWCVFGCGGDRDPHKRPLMGAAAAAADEVIVTSDNPRHEDPLAIIQHIATGLRQHARVELEADRARAIESAIGRAASEDVVLVAGKGHETVQEIRGTRYPFSDQAHVLAALARRATPPLRTGAAA
ncbi:MAG: UDP-N-acetylmuramoyl-L-alanyl-D-glutamate--2,6-diaminopimelate ligase, partial [Burkholderiaceae bacterium]